MYAHLEIKSVTPMAITGYKLRSKIKYEYGAVTIDAECMFPQDAVAGTVTLRMYRDDKASRVRSDEFLESDASLDPEKEELNFLRKILPENDIVYILSLFGLRRPGTVYGKRRRVRIAINKPRMRSYYERYELLFSQSVDEAWLKTYGAMFGNRKREK